VKDWDSRLPRRHHSVPRSRAAKPWLKRWDIWPMGQGLAGLLDGDTAPDAGWWSKSLPERRWRRWNPGAL